MGGFDNAGTTKTVGKHLFDNKFHILYIIAWNQVYCAMIFGKVNGRRREWTIKVRKCPSVEGQGLRNVERLINITVQIKGDIASDGQENGFDGEASQIGRGHLIAESRNVGKTTEG